MSARRSQAAVVGAIIVALVLVAAIGVLLYYENTYRLASQLTSERIQTLDMAAELGRGALAVFIPSTYYNLTYICVQESFPYAYELYSIAATNGSGRPLVLGPGNSVYVGLLGSLSRSHLPISAGPGGSVQLFINGTWSSVYLVLQSGWAITAVEAIPVSEVNSQLVQQVCAQSQQLSLSQPSPKVNGTATVNYLNGTNNTLGVVDAIPITIYNPGVGQLQQGVQLNITIDVKALEDYLSKNGVDLATNDEGLPTDIAFGVPGPKGTWTLTNAWVEWFNKSYMHVWVKLPFSVNRNSNRTLYLLVLNASTLGSEQYGVNSYYDPGLDNIGYVMNSGLLYQVYNGQGQLISDVSYSTLKKLSSTCSSLARQLDSETWGFTYYNLSNFTYLLPLYTAGTPTFNLSYLICAIIMNNGSVDYINSSLSANGSLQFQPYYSEPEVLTPVNKSGMLQALNFTNVFVNLSLKPNTSSWLLKAVGWLSVRHVSPQNPTIKLITDDGGLFLLRPSPGYFNFTDWLGYEPGLSNSTLSLWADDGAPPYDSDITWPDPASSTTSLSSLGVSNPGDYRVTLIYYQDAGYNYALIVGQVRPHGPSSALTISWYAPSFPLTDQYPWLHSPVQGLLVGPSPSQGWIVG